MVGRRQTRKAVDMAGQKIGRLSVVRRAESIVRGKLTYAAWECICDCGKVVVVAGTDMRDGGTKSCGCLRNENIAKSGRRTAAKHRALSLTPEAIAKRTKHGRARDGSSDATYMSWEAMNQRCRNPNNARWHRYGGMGVTICERWSVFENFLADMGERPKGKTLDRIDPTGNYEPGNCRWATPTEQANNTRWHHARRASS